MRTNADHGSHLRPVDKEGDTAQDEKGYYEAQHRVASFLAHWIVIIHVLHSLLGMQFDRAAIVVEGDQGTRRTAHISVDGGIFDRQAGKVGGDRGVVSTVRGCIQAK